MTQGKGLDDAFDIKEGGKTPEEIIEIVEEIIEVPEGVISDADFIRTELKENIITAKTALKRALDIQKEDEKPRNTEVIANLVNTINSCVSQLISLNKIEADIAIKKGNSDTGGDGGRHVTNNILVANTSDIIEKITDGLKKG